VDRTALYLFDTSVLLALLRGKQLGSYLNQTFRLSEVINRPIISVVSHGEIMAMAERNAWGDKKRAGLQNMLDDLITIDLSDPLIIANYVLVDQKNLSHPKGARNISDNDMWIAATAIATGALLLTTDQDFLHLHPNVCRVQYVDPNSKLALGLSGDQTTIQ
jgi:tRNA(fMet)-specific endonuclease VapC